jgi:hypothetical protein
MPDSPDKDFPYDPDDGAARSGPGPVGDPAGDDAPVQGIWLTAAAWLPPELLFSQETADGAAGPAGFGQGSVLDQLAPGPVLATFTADAADGVAGTGQNSSSRAGHPAAETGEMATAGEVAEAGEVAGLAALRDEELTGVIRSWRKLASWAQAGELAAVAELSSRRHAEAVAAGERASIAVEAANDEIAAALTLTGRAAQLLTDRAAAFRELPATLAALADGRIDMPKALVMLTGLAGQDPDLSRTIEAQVINRAATQTTGQLRAALNRALLAADPDAADKRRQAEEKVARVEQGPEPGGVTASLTGRYLPVTETVAAWNRITALARQLKTSGASGTLDELRVRVYLALLTGQATAHPATSAGTGGQNASGQDEAAGTGTQVPGPADAPVGDTGPADVQVRDTCAADSTGTQSAGTPATAQAATAQAAGAQAAEATGTSAAARVSATPITAPAGAVGLTGTVNLTVPMATLLGIADAPGELGGFGPVTAYTAREIAAGALGSPKVRWCVTMTSNHGEPIGHGCATRAPARLHVPARAGARTPKPGSAGGTSEAGGASDGWVFTVKISALAGSDCGHQRESMKYRPPPSLWHLIQIRNQRCTFPGCRMPAVKCDDDHTLAYEKGGRTCECNLGPLCRHHHRVKQLQGWRLEQPEPGILVWVTPSGWKYITGPASYAA